MAQMTHRQRVLATLAHQQPDRVPIDLGATRDSSIVVEGYERLKAHFGVQEENRLTSRMMRIVDVNEAILQALDVDLRGIFPSAPPDTLIGENGYRDEWGIERIRPAGSHYYDLVSSPLSGEITVQDIARYPWPEPDAPIRRRGLKERAKAIHAAGYASVLNVQSAFVHSTQYLRGFEDWFIDLAANKRIAAALFDAAVEVSLGICRNLLEAVDGEVDVIMASDDLGVQQGLMMRPEVYRELLKPRHARYFQLLHDLSPAKVFFHTCGSVAAILDDLVDMGVDILHPVQVTAAGMDPRALKARYGNHLSFWGAIDTQYVLPYGSVADVKAEVERRIEELGAGGGYIVGAVHNLQPDVPLENVLAMYQHAVAYRPSFAR
ncbi:MAG: hypothetical protein GXY76_10005 [Chloroflexi bacterium]|nr:hypothetical protein [Chloroflexota bacterium]